MTSNQTTRNTTDACCSTGPRMPRVGDVVHYVAANEDEKHNGASFHAAIVTRVWGPECVNLKVLPDCAPAFDRTSVQKGHPVDGADPKPWKGFWYFA